MSDLKGSKRRAYGYLKRFLDVFFSLILLALLFLPMLIIALLVGLTSEGGVLFRQERVGYGGKLFVCYKFRTMYHFAPRNIPTAELSRPSDYITPIGAFLRRSSLDELPQLFNVLRGDMSLVGPRPLIFEEGEIHALRRRCGVYELRPGLTGLAQINGRDMISDTEKVRLDVRYARRISLSEDTRIIARTVRKAFFDRDVAY